MSLLPLVPIIKWLACCPLVVFFIKWLTPCLGESYTIFKTSSGCVFWHDICLSIFSIQCFFSFFFFKFKCIFVSAKMILNILFCKFISTPHTIPFVGQYIPKFYSSSGTAISYRVRQNVRHNNILAGTDNSAVNLHERDRGKWFIT